MARTVNNNWCVSTCPLCGSASIHRVGLVSYEEPLFFGSVEIRLVERPEFWRCRQCDSGFVQNAVTENDALGLYSMSELRWGTQPIAEYQTPDLLDLIKATLATRPKILDIGCSSGGFLQYARSLGCAAFGVEASERARAVGHANGHAILPSLVAAAIHAPFDAIFAVDLVEHWYDLTAFFRQCRSVLSDDGIVVILTGNVNCLSARLAGSKWWYVRYPEHVRFPSMKYLASLAGFRVRRVVPMFASKQHAAPIMRALAKALGEMLRSNYTGRPSLVKDHYGVVLAKASDV